MYHIVLAFDRQASLDAWHNSPERTLGLAAAAPFIEGELKLKPLSGLGLWFRTTQPSPPRWKIAVVTWLGICPTVYAMFLLLGPLLASWALLPRVMVLTSLVVIIMTWLVAPQLTQLLKPWLYPATRSYIS